METGCIVLSLRPTPELGPTRSFGPVLTVGFHSFNLRILNLRVSNPDNLIVDVLLTRCRISMCQGLGPKKYEEFSETDRILSRSFKGREIRGFGPSWLSFLSGELTNTMHTNYKTL